MKTQMNLAENLFKKLDDPNLPEDYTMNNFYEEMGIPKKHRTDFASAAILKQALEMKGINVMSTKYFKTVLFPIQVAYGDYCWGGQENRICGHFDNEDGNPVCVLKIGDLKHDKDGYVPKPSECINLKNKSF